jgi:hypothetical protein
MRASTSRPDARLTVAGSHVAPATRAIHAAHSCGV